MKCSKRYYNAGGITPNILKDIDLYNLNGQMIGYVSNISNPVMPKKKGGGQERSKNLRVFGWFS